ncbi:heterokaryon incompatibility protein-domain-containing protein [Lophiotrema nucula]|uniref:Heterokaryon incompatibility protein-domain-containing protein n=1 Tax=Lophiotrema nucula TaxID=690887 RepID=A0A6A5ZFA8_9PLEO|nr:heterokaryon incompatibility protein-domain-containing protein [Lophiotrema nucula]
MRLLNATTRSVHDFQSSDDIPDFAILSHTWGEEECTLQMMDDPKVVRRKGYEKIKLSCSQALRDGLQWVWVDTCCIDKSSTAELSEAINSMFRWYRNAKVCYAYLSDIGDISELPISRWFTRVWTLQELIAPRNMRFYDSAWRCIGTKTELAAMLSQTSGIDHFVLTSGKYKHIQIATKMSWAAKRKTTRIEDQSYCLLGISAKAFVRLQEEIMKTSDDQSLFAWGLTERPRTLQQFLNEWASTDITDMHGLFADSPSDFVLSDRIKVLENPHTVVPPIVSNNGVRIELQVLQDGTTQFAALICTVEGHYEYYLGFPLKPWGHRWTTRIKELLLVPARDLAREGDPYRPPSICLIKPPVGLFTHPVPKTSLKIVPRTTALRGNYRLEEMLCSAHAKYSPEEQTVTLAADLDTLHAAITYSPERTLEQYLSLAEPNLVEVFRQSRSCRGLPCGIEMYSSERADRDRGKLGADRSPCFKILQPSFAILVGGTLTAPWVNCVTVLSDAGCSAEFHSLLQADQKESLQLKEPRSLPWQHEIHTSRKVQAIAYRRNYTEKRKNGDGFELLRLREDYVFVDARIQLVSNNLVERGLWLSVELGWSKKTLGKLQDKKWWELLPN